MYMSCTLSAYGLLRLRQLLLELPHDLFGNRPDFRGQFFERASVTRFEVIHRDHEGEQFVIEVRFVDQCAKEAQTFLIDQSPESRDDFGSPHRFSDFFVPDSTGRVESAA